VILGPSSPHAGKGAAKSAATDAVTETLMRCRAAQRRFRNTLLFAVADEALLGGAREAMRRSLAWASIVDDRRLQEQLTKAQADDAKEKAKTSREGAAKVVRLAWCHIVFPIKTENTTVGLAFDLDHLSIASKDRAAIPVAIYEKAKNDGIAKERLGPDALWLHLKSLWPEDKPHLGIGEVADWFSSYVYLPKLRDRVVLDSAIRDAIGKLDPAFGCVPMWRSSINAQSVGRPRPPCQEMLVIKRVWVTVRPATSASQRPGRDNRAVFSAQSRLT